MSTRTLLGALAGGLITSFVLWLHARWSSSRDQGGVPLTELARRYRNWEIGGVVLLALAVLATWLGLLALNRHYPETDADAVFRLTPNALYWAVVAFFIGNLVATGPTHLLYSWLLGERFAEFRDYQTRKFGFDAWRWMLPFYLVFGAGCAAVTFALVDWYVVLTPTTIVINNLGSTGELRYTYEDVAEIRISDRVEGTDGSVVEQASLVVYFNDGSRWSSAKDPSRATPEELQRIATYVAESSGLPLVSVAVLRYVEL